MKWIDLIDGEVVAELRAKVAEHPAKVGEHRAQVSW